MRWLRSHWEWKPEFGASYDWHRWLHLRWWRIWLTTTRCSRCRSGRMPYSLTETWCWSCQTSNFGYTELEKAISLNPPRRTTEQDLMLKLDPWSTYRYWRAMRFGYDPFRMVATNPIWNADGRLA